MNDLRVGLITLAKFCERTGLSTDTVRTMMKRGHWVQGKQWVKDPLGHVLVDFEAYEQWARGQTQAA